MIENINIFLNVGTGLLLVITIIFCLSLSKKISAFNSNKTELAKFLLDFNDSIGRAESNINQLKELGTTVDENLKNQIKKARFLANDLSFLSEKGENVAQNLEGKLNMTRDISRRMAAENSIGPAAVTTQKREIISGSEQPFKARSLNTAAVNKNQESTSKRQALDALLQEIARRKQGDQS